MIKRTLRIVLVSLALVLTLAGSLDLNRVGAQIEPINNGCDVCGAPGPWFCTGTGGMRCSGYMDSQMDMQ